MKKIVLIIMWPTISLLAEQSNLHVALRRIAGLVVLCIEAGVCRTSGIHSFKVFRRNFSNVSDTWSFISDNTVVFAEAYIHV